VFLSASKFSGLAQGLPHARGGVSTSLTAQGYFVLPSPRPWGCFLDYKRRMAMSDAFPTPVGVFLPKTYDAAARPRLPHARGGVSPALRIVGLTATAFPTPVGVFLGSACRTAPAGRLPHARGGVSPVTELALGHLGPSPRPWGCFYCSAVVDKPPHAFPTPVGVFPQRAMRPAFRQARQSSQ
jgi:hypothetical protein